LDALADEMRVDLEGSGAVGFAVAYAGTAYIFVCSLAREPLSGAARSSPSRHMMTERGDHPSAGGARQPSAP